WLSLPVPFEGVAIVTVVPPVGGGFVSVGTFEPVRPLRKITPNGPPLGPNTYVLGNPPGPLPSAGIVLRYCCTSADVGDVFAEKVSGPPLKLPCAPRNCRWNVPLFVPPS